MFAHLNLDERWSSLPERSWRRSFSRMARAWASSVSALFVRPLPQAWTGGCRAPVPPRSLGLFLNLGNLFKADHVDRDLHQVAHHRLDVSADIAHFGELGGFYLEEWRTGKAGQAAGNFSFAHSGGPDHDDVLGSDLFRHLLDQLLPADAVAESDGNGPLGSGWPTTYLSSSSTICRGVISSRPRRRAACLLVFWGISSRFSGWRPGSGRCG